MELSPQHHFCKPILQQHTVQHSLCVVLVVFLLQFSLLLFPSLGYTVPDKYFINCGSDSSVTENGKLYAGESTVKTSFSNSNTETTESSVPSALYKTARIFRKDSWYKFNIDTNGTYLLRLHFFPFSSSTNLSSARFNVSVPGFWLLQNSDATNGTNNNSALVKEFFMHINSSSLKITFRPLSSSFAFVNTIELFILPLHLISDSVSRFTYSGNQLGLETYSAGLYSLVLENKVRLNVGGQAVYDSLLRKWIADDSYLNYPGNAESTSYAGQIKSRVSDDADGPNATNFTAPSDVYGTAREIKNISAGNLTWAPPVEKNIDHLVRFHFCDYENPQSDLTYFNLSIYDSHVIDINNDGNVSKELPAPYFYDFVVNSDDSGRMKVGVIPDATAPKPNAFLNGLEIMKMIETSNSVPLDDSDSKNTLLMVLGSVVGGVVLVFVLVVLGFLWRLKMRKENPVENSDWLPVPVTTGGSSHSRLTALTSQGSPLPNINLGLKIPLIDLQLATNNFHATQLIGKGGFGNVYKGVLKNGINVAVKRSQPGTGQGLPEFQTEIMVLSKIRHRHLVSLIGYCDERFEMILVYEYMEKGTLRDHLYNTNLPSLPWKQRLEICIGAARGLHYLHKGASGGIIHRDVKSTNILLDDNLVAKVTDFGLSKSGPLDTQLYVSTNVKGTFGYLDPEYFRSQQLTEKSDVYSFGVVLLEVLCARAVIDPSLPREQINLAEWGLLCKNKGILEEIIDPSIKGQIDQNSLRKFSETVEKCLQEDGSYRPTMGDVLWDLEYALQLQRGANAIQREPYEDSSSSVSASLQLPNVRRLPSLPTLSEADDSIVRGDETNRLHMVLGFPWRFKMRKGKPVENSDWLPTLVTAGGSSDIIQGPPLPNINLGLKIPLLHLQLATNNFHTTHIIGKGSLGSVYKGVLKNGMIVAVKRSQPGSGRGLPEFQTEIMVLSKVRHRNLVSLIGYCDEKSEMILVYEYMEKGTLRDHLYNTNLPSLSWNQRLEICIGAAKGLQYLHKGAVGGIIHRDVKSTNILLDENHVAKVADFGLSKTGHLYLQQYDSTSVKGTFGYLDPEYLRTHKLTEKSDVYSFGVVLLEVLCARPVIDSLLPREQINLVEWGMVCISKGVLQGIIDTSMKDQIDQNSLRKFSETVEKSLQEVGSDRPTMADVLWDLEYALQLQTGVHQDSNSSASTSLQFPNVLSLPSISTTTESG